MTKHIPMTVMLCVDKKSWIKMKYKKDKGKRSHQMCNETRDIKLSLDKHCAIQIQCQQLIHTVFMNGR